MPASRPLNEIRAQAAALIVERLRRASVAAVANDLKISRQAVYDISKGKYCPSLSTIQRACEAWKVQFKYHGVLIDQRSFGKKPKKLAALPMQEELFKIVGSLENRDFEIVQTKPVGRAVEITLRLTLPLKKSSAG